MFIKRISMTLLALVIAVAMAGCGSQNNHNGHPETDAKTNKNSEHKLISVSSKEVQIIYELNDSTAARQLYDQLPLSVEVEDFSTNEKIFYPPLELDPEDALSASGGAGVLAYYTPWGDIVMFYNDFPADDNLFQLGTAIEGEEDISRLSGTVEVKVYE